MKFFDTHCHIHEAQYELVGDDGVRSKWLQAGKPDPDDMLTQAKEDGVVGAICVGTTAADSQLAVGFAQPRSNIWASVGIHPHEASLHINDEQTLLDFENLAANGQKIVAIGECGLDYYYTHSPKAEQERLLRFQLGLAQKHKLPLILHVRDAFEDFWPIFDEYKGLSGVVHSFTATTKELRQALDRGLYIGLNGIMTFTNDPKQLEAAAAVPLDKLLLETDAPFLTPAPERGKICQPKHVVVTARFLSKLRGDSLGSLANASTVNAAKLFGLEL
jgi:TatD DNase family protein